MGDPVRESIKQVDKNTWLIGALILHRSNGYSDTATWYDRDDDLSYILTDAPDPAPPFVPLPPDHPNIVLVYDAGNRSAVWSLGNSAFCKVKVRVNDTTREATTLEFVQKQQPRFDTPKILHQAEHDGRSYLFLSRVPGRTLANAWPTLDEKWKHHYVNAVVKTCETLECWKGDTIGGVDGKNIPEQYLIKYGADYNYDAENLRQACESMGMDCSEFVFYHADLGPGNIIVEDIPDIGSIGIIDWETAGYFPRAWIRTKFRISSGLDLPSSVEDEHWWRWEVQESLGVRGFEDFSKEWECWWY
ncbi:unnamed protein product [Penicillium salamii]|uniref:Aminoglycoside phosphotransferase domain-containing protein n=1 Tax=Penicillium salamii TaxID=1612424 RepID=A0A9W4JY49_9EURO|nr:unnamed protein product [Penicillium salamii]CAG8101096.1 unnamed protein product [Penicillium salamii]CAG8153465.1 unnamed protein product [Penicillium salamii]CAG8162706.1 unnamed protein product [Penicillium salamii]CAG8217137.1 unnamed protein product [Penicillium salamii]